jgi:hypothetical protein
LHEVFTFFPPCFFFKVICEIAIPKVVLPPPQAAPSNMIKRTSQASNDRMGVVHETSGFGSLSPGSSQQHSSYGERPNTSPDTLRKCHSTGAMNVFGGRPVSSSAVRSQTMQGKALQSRMQQEIGMGTFERPKTASALELPKMRAKTVERSTNHLRLQATSNRTGINAQRQNDYLDSEKPGYWLLSFGQGLVKTAEPNSQNEDGDYANRGTSLGNMSATLRSSLLKKEPEVTERAETYTRFVEVARLASPQLFGELILLDPLRRSGVSLVSETAVDLVVVRKSILQGLQAQVCIFRLDLEIEERIYFHRSVLGWDDPLPPFLLFEVL